MKQLQNRKKALLMTLIAIMPVITASAAYAGGYDTWLSPFSSLVDSMISFMGIIGKALLAWAIFEVATALFSHDTSQMPQALRRIGAGTLLIFIQTLITAMSSGGASSGSTGGEAATALQSLEMLKIMMNC